MVNWPIRSVISSNNSKEEKKLEEIRQKAIEIAIDNCKHCKRLVGVKKQSVEVATKEKFNPALLILLLIPPLFLLVLIVWALNSNKQHKVDLDVCWICGCPLERSSIITKIK